MARSSRLAPAVCVLMAGLLCANSGPARAADPQRAQILALVDKGGPRMGEVAQQIWSFAEVGDRPSPLDYRRKAAAAKP